MRKRRNRRNGIHVLGILLLVVLVGGIVIIHSINIDTETQIVEVNTTNCYAGIRVTLFGIDITRFGETTVNLNTSKIGEYQIKYKPFWSTKTYQKIVKVVDRQAPEIVLEGETEIDLLTIDEFVEKGFTATDNYDGDITDKVSSKIVAYRDDYYEVQYYVEDSSNNIAIATRRINLKSGMVYLTFDDGPSLNITPKILDVLKENEISATFFVIGYGEEKENIIKRMYEEGHTIGLHGLSHDYSEIYTDIDTLMENFYELEQKVAETTNGYQSKIIRFPGGSSNTISKNYCKGIMSQAVEKVEKEGYIYFDWNVEAGDAGNARTSEEVYENVISGLMLGRNNVVLMHDAANKDYTLEALQLIIDYCKENNYGFKSITANTKPVHHNVKLNIK